jgi:putative zinc finger protein
MTHQYATWDAAYVLGALSDADRREFEGHLTTCSTCHRAVGELAGMPGLLGQLTRHDVESIDQFGALDDGAPRLRPEVLDSLLDTVRSRRRRARMLAWGGGCAAAAAVAVGLFVAIRPNPVVSPPASQPGAASTLSMAPVRPSPLTATVNLVSHSWGTGIEMNCTYAAESANADHDDDDGDRLAMVAVGRDGSHTRLATWVARPGIVASTAGSVALRVDQIASVQIVSADTGDVLLQTPP